MLFRSLPRVRDFRGLKSNSFDGRGNYSFGLSEQSVFPEMSSDTVSSVQGMNITVVTTASDNQGGLELLKSVGFPFEKRVEKGG